MFKNYFKTAFRSLSRHKSYTLINVAGLAVGIAVCMIIFIIIQFQTSFDNFHAKKSRIYRVLTESHPADAGNISYLKNVPFPMPAGLKAAFPQLEQVAPVYASHNDELQVMNNNGTPVKNFKEQSGVFYTTASFFTMFDFPLLAGSYASLDDPNNVLLTKETADTYFGDWKTAMGKTIKLTGQAPRDTRGGNNAWHQRLNRQQRSRRKPFTYYMCRAAPCSASSRRSFSRGLKS